MVSSAHYSNNRKISNKLLKWVGHVKSIRIAFINIILYGVKLIVSMEIDFILMNHNYQFNQREKRMVLKRSVEWPAFNA